VPSPFVRVSVPWPMSQGADAGRHAQRRPAAAPLSSKCARAVWVFCGDPIRCQASFRNCWLKHLVRPSPTPAAACLQGLRSALRCKPETVPARLLHGPAAQAPPTQRPHVPLAPAIATKALSGLCCTHTCGMVPARRGAGQAARRRAKPLSCGACGAGASGGHQPDGGPACALDVGCH